MLNISYLKLMGIQPAQYKLKAMLVIVNKRHRTLFVMSNDTKQLPSLNNGEIKYSIFS